MQSILTPAQKPAGTKNIQVGSTIAIVAEEGDDLAGADKLAAEGDDAPAVIPKEDDVPVAETKKEAEAKATLLQASSSATASASGSLSICAARALSTCTSMGRPNNVPEVLIVDPGAQLAPRRRYKAAPSMVSDRIWRRRFMGGGSQARYYGCTDADRIGPRWPQGPSP